MILDVVDFAAMMLIAFAWIGVVVFVVSVAGVELK